MISSNTRIVRNRKGIVVKRYDATNAPINLPHDFENPFNRERFRLGKTKKDREGGAHRRAAERRTIPIRCTSSHNPGSSIERSADFWGRG